MLTLISATRLSLQDFQNQSLLGRCLPRLGQFQPLALRLSHNNQEPLGQVYNRAIERAKPDDVLVFVHDDVHIDDWMLAQRLDDALQQFDVVGVVGNRRVVKGQLAWYQRPANATGTEHVWDSENLSGTICHGPNPQSGRLSLYGPAPSAVRLLDGVLLAARAASLQASGVRFDPQLAFHFYDLDFCLSAHQAGLRLGTWPLAITHQSGGDSILSAAWQNTRPLFEKKWWA